MCPPCQRERVMLGKVHHAEGQKALTDFDDFGQRASLSIPIQLQQNSGLDSYSLALVKLIKNIKMDIMTKHGYTTLSLSTFCNTLNKLRFITILIFNFTFFTILVFANSGMVLVLTLNLCQWMKNMLQYKVIISTFCYSIHPHIACIKN